jgi:hypothetical protein
MIDVARGAYTTFNVEVSRSATEPSRYLWKVLDSVGNPIQASSYTYANDREALREAKAAVREISWKILNEAQGRVITYRAPLRAQAA